MLDSGFFHVGGPAQESTAGEGSGVRLLDDRAVLAKGDVCAQLERSGHGRS
jgi:hypothetical protein